MAAPVPPGAPRPNTQRAPPPNYFPGSQGNPNPNAIADNMQNLSINRPPPPMPGSGPRPPPPFAPSPQPFPQQGPSFGGPTPMARPGPPPPALARQGGQPPMSQPGLPSNAPLGRPIAPPVSQAPFGARPFGGPGAPPPVPSGGFPVSGPLGGVAAAPPLGARLNAFGSPPPVASGMSVPPPSGMPGGPVSNGPPMVGTGSFPRGPNYPPAGATPQAPYSQPPTAPFVRGPPQTPSSPLTAPPGPSMPPPATFPGAPHSRPAVSALPYGMPPQQVVPPPAVSGSVPPSMIYGMGPLPNQSMTTIPSAMGQPGTSLPGPSKIDPNQIPRPGSSSSPIIYETRQGNQANPPPPATSDYIARDTGNCSPRYMRCTINQIPCTVDLLSTSGMQLALTVQPLALPHPSEEPIQVVDFGESGPVRCSRCKGYINPFMKFIDQGRKFICNLCGYTDETPRDYHCNLGPDGRRRDADERPELCRGTVEFVATKEYMVRDPMPNVYFFLIDVSMNAIQTGATAAACSAIQQVLSDLPEGPRTFVGIATFDSTIHFYNLKRALQQPLMLIVPDVQDVYTPLETDVVVQLSECRQHLELLLESIPTMFQESKAPESAFGAAVKAAFLAMKSTGGKLMVFQSVLPSVGLGALSSREAEGRANVSAGEKEAHKLLQPADKTLKTMAIEFAEYQVCVDIFITTQTYIDIASISVIPRTTGGQVYYYYPFSALSDPPKLYNDLRWNITRPQGFEAVMRVRCSQGIQVQDYSGNFCKRIPTDIDLPAIDCDKAIMVTLKHDDKLQDGTECAFQCALLYTTIYGERRIRVTTLSLPCTNMLSNLFRSADLDSQFACMLKQAAGEIPSKALPLVKDQVINACVNTLYSYRKFCATVTSSGQLILPEALKLLPLYALALTKSVGLRTDGRIDDRSFWINYVSSLSTPLAIPLVYPRMIAVHDLDAKDNEGSVLPPPIPLSSEHISNEGVYFLENGEDGLIYVGDSVNSDILQKLFGVPSVAEIPSQYVLQLYDNPLSKKFNDVVNEIRRQRCSYLRLKLCKNGDPSGMLFLTYMVEDRTASGSSYVEFLVQVHRQIQLKMN
ncbi:PREDICTED: protein transport protein Sec24-like At4g32640 [Tarenaya hassleriana]|uniref:protein transport protein Sec24-like At4g32640 n=1 Tax=Tarenaya hassleriana TaxID=28532 RepID=UPI00053CA35A|nr:PREDICTED: protein transport protein Sec24-like At4g32640 [Tarenaya hassleriana]XP_010534688.1 PREDICTED: protein transport protein Sec24-like At4g32640 [Tarenaya hassleriana]